MVASFHKADDIKHTNLSYFYEYYLQLKPKSMLKDHVPIYEVQTSFLVAWRIQVLLKHRIKCPVLMPHEVTFPQGCLLKLLEVRVYSTHFFSMCMHVCI